MFFGIDIDQTLASGFQGESLEASVAYYTGLGLSIPETVSTYNVLFQLPEVLRIHSILADAVEGVRLLVGIGKIGYYTVRKAGDPKQERDMHEATRDWLVVNQFPNPTQVNFCQSVLDKLVKLYEQEKHAHEQLFLIDDRWKKAVEAFDVLDKHSLETAQMAEILRKRLVIIAFGVDTVPNPTGIQLVALPSWRYVEDVVRAWWVKG